MIPMQSPVRHRVRKAPDRQTPNDFPAVRPAEQADPASQQQVAASDMFSRWFRAPVVCYTYDSCQSLVRLCSRDADTQLTKYTD